MNGGLNKNDGWQRPTCPLPLLKRTQTWPYANSQTQNIFGMALILPLKQRNMSNRVRRKLELSLTLIAIIKKGFVGGSTNMIVLQNSKQIAQYVDSGGFTSTRS